jgi:hypothetical protein
MAKNGDFQLTIDTHSWNEGVAPLAFVTQRRFEISVPVMAITISDDLDHRFRGIVRSG